MPRVVEDRCAGRARLAQVAPESLNDLLAVALHVSQDEDIVGLEAVLLHQQRPHQLDIAQRRASQVFVLAGVIAHSHEQRVALGRIPASWIQAGPIEIRDGAVRLDAKGICAFRRRISARH